MEVSDEVLAFVHTYIRSLWTLEVFLLLHKRPDVIWNEREIVVELRASNAAVREGLIYLTSAGIVRRTSNGEYGYLAGTSPTHGVADELAKLYEERPLAVLKTIAAAPDERVRIFADAFVIKRQRE